MLVARLGQSEFFLEFDAAGSAFRGALVRRWRQSPPGVYPVLREDCAFQLRGEAVHDVLAQVCNVNFAALDLDSQPVIMTLMIGVAVLVVPEEIAGARRYRFWCDPTFGPSLSETLGAVVVECGGINNRSIGMNREQAQKFFAEHNIRYVLAQFVDIHGSAKAKAVPVEHLDMVLTDGAGFAGFALWGFGMGPEGPDYMAVGDLSTLQVIPWMPGYARLICNGVVNGKPYPYCSRVALQAQIARLKERGLTLFTGIEPEFMLLVAAAGRHSGARRSHRRSRQAVLRLQGPVPHARGAR